MLRWRGAGLNSPATPCGHGWAFGRLNARCAPRAGPGPLSLGQAVRFLPSTPLSSDEIRYIMPSQRCRIGRASHVLRPVSESEAATPEAARGPSIRRLIAQATAARHPRRPPSVSVSGPHGRSIRVGVRGEPGRDAFGRSGPSESAQSLAALDWRATADAEKLTRVSLRRPLPETRTHCFRLACS